MTKDDPYAPVRVKDRDTGYHLTIQRQQLPHGNYQELKQDAVDPITEQYLPPEFSDGTSTAAADTKKES